MRGTLLIIEDENLLRAELERHYKSEGWTLATADSLAAARRTLVDEHFEPLVVISDMSLPDGNALDLLEDLRGQARSGEWILLTGFGTIPDSVRALRLGAYDFLEKPCPVERLDLVVAGAARSAQAQRRLRDQSSQQSRRYGIEAFVGSSQKAVEAREMLEKLSQVPFTSLVIGGETGTGKGLAARILHSAGVRSDGPLIEVNCAAMPEELLESELFGHEAGAFTGARGRHRGLMEQADGGTLFLDEIGEMIPALQAKLLKAIEDQRVRRLGGDKEIAVDVQVIAASNRDLAEQVSEGKFREDLYHRLSVFRMDLPPLRERHGDLDDLIPLFIAEYNAKAGKRVRVVSESAMERLSAYTWPGNVRELRNVVERCVLFAEDEVLPERWFQLPDDGKGVGPPAGIRVDDESIHIPLNGSMTLESMERAIIEHALERSDGNITAAARRLGVTRQTLRYRIQKHELDEVD